MGHVNTAKIGKLYSLDSMIESEIYTKEENKLSIDAMNKFDKCMRNDCT